MLKNSLAKDTCKENQRRLPVIVGTKSLTLLNSVYLKLRKVVMSIRRERKRHENTICCRGRYQNRLRHRFFRGGSHAKTVHGKMLHSFIWSKGTYSLAFIADFGLTFASRNFFRHHGTSPKKIKSLNF